MSLRKLRRVVRTAFTRRIMISSARIIRPVCFREPGAGTQNIRNRIHSPQAMPVKAGFSNRDN